MLSYFLAHKIYSDKSATTRVSKPAIRIATLGMAIGLAVMIVSVAVVLGFKHTIRNKVMGFGSHITVSNFITVQTADMAPVCCSDSMAAVLKKAPGVKHVQRYAMTQGLLKTDNDFLGIMFKGIAEEQDTAFLHESLIEGSLPHFSSEKSNNAIVISRIMADKMMLKTGDRVFAYFVGDNNVRMRRFTVAGIYETNLTKYDETICYTDLYTTVKLNGWEEGMASGYEILVDDINRIDDTADWFVNRVNRTEDGHGNTFATQTVQEANPQIFTWLDLLDLNVWIILALMVCVASVTIISGLLIIMLERVSMIGLLKALGSRNAMVRHTFLWFGFFIIARGILLGDILGVGLCLLQHFTGIVTLDPQTYYVSQVPVELSIPVLILLNVGTIFICTLVLVIPTLFVSRIRPAQTMKFGE